MKHITTLAIPSVLYFWPLRIQWNCYDYKKQSIYIAPKVYRQVIPLCAVVRQIRHSTIRKPLFKMNIDFWSQKASENFDNGQYCTKKTGRLTLLKSFMFVESNAVPYNPKYSNTVVSFPPWLSLINTYKMIRIYNKLMFC